jgi:hypothetical protein
MFEAGDETNRLGKNSHKSMLQGKNYEWWEIVEYKRLETTSKSLPMRKQLYTKEISNQVESGIVNEGAHFGNDIGIQILMYYCEWNKDHLYRNIKIYSKSSLANAQLKKKKNISSINYDKSDKSDLSLILFSVVLQSIGPEF